MYLNAVSDTGFQQDNTIYAVKHFLADKTKLMCSKIPFMKEHLWKARECKAKTQQETINV